MSLVCFFLTLFSIWSVSCFSLSFFLDYSLSDNNFSCFLFSSTCLSWWSKRSTISGIWNSVLKKLIRWIIVLTLGGLIVSFFTFWKTVFRILCQSGLTILFFYPENNSVSRSCLDLLFFGDYYWSYSSKNGFSLLKSYYL